MTARIGEQVCSFYTDDPDEYIEELVKRADETLRHAGGSFAKAVLILTDAIMRAERAKVQDEGKAATQAEPKAAAKRPGNNMERKDRNQVSMWDLMKEDGT